MLTDAEDKGIVENEVGALGLCYVKVVALSVWCRVERQEGVGRVTTSVRYGKTNSQSMRILFVGVLEVGQ